MITKGGIDEYDSEGNNINTRYRISDTASHVRDPSKKHSKTSAKNIRSMLGDNGVSQKYLDAMSRVYERRKTKDNPKANLDEMKGDDLSDFFPDDSKKVVAIQNASAAVQQTSSVAISAIKKVQETAQTNPPCRESQSPRSDSGPARA